MTDAPVVRLITCFGSERDLDLARHFFAHYLKLGVAPELMHVIVHASREDHPALKAADALLTEFGVTADEYWIGPYTSGELWKRRQALQARMADRNDWVISADLDELHQYPAPLKAVIAQLEKNHFNVLQGPLIDRVSRTGELAEIKPKPPLPSQFPLETDLMCAVGKIPGRNDAAGTVKMMLFKGFILPGLGGHGPARHEGVAYAAGKMLAAFDLIKTPQFRFDYPAKVHHYRWTAGLIEYVEARIATPGASPAGSTYGQRIVDYLKRNNGRINLNDVSIDRSRAWMWKLAKLRREAAKPAEPAAPPPAKPAVVTPPPSAEPGWRVRRLTIGSDQNQFHSHSYYDVRVLDRTRSTVAAHRMTFQGRWMKADDAVDIGLVDWAEGGFKKIGETTAWSWQQGPLTQWIPESDEVIWNERHEDGFRSRLYDKTIGIERTLPRTVYAVAPDGTFALSLNLARIDKARPGYGYTGGTGGRLDEIAPSDDGVWRMDLKSGESSLVLPFARAAEFVLPFLEAGERAEHERGLFTYWFNHVKLSPDGKRFTVKFRWRDKTLKEGWRGVQSFSLTCDVDGGRLHMLIRGGSHVMWLDNRSLFCWDQPAGRLVLLENEENRREYPASVFNQNVHIHHLPAQPGRYLYDTPYSETVSLRIFDETDGSDLPIAHFENHVPHHGPFRCDLHPVTTGDGNRTVVTSLHDGGRQLYAVEPDQ